MRDTKQPLDLSPLKEDYDIIGELGGAAGGRTYFGTRKGAASKRRDDNTGVLIEVLVPPAGDEGNALSHLASDAQTLMRASHRRLVPVIEARWIGKDVLAVVTKRTTEPTLAQLLVTGERFTNPRAAAILRDVNGLLEWARGQQLVHRSVAPDRIYLESKTDRVTARFAVSPIPRAQRDHAADVDARTIARLAMAMLTGKVDPKAYEGKSLAEMRPDLPEKLIEETEALLSGKAKDIDVAAYLALVGMADPLAAGESEAERVRAEVLEEQRVEREKLANERADFERLMAEERATLATEAEDLRQKLAAEGEELRRIAAEERATQERQADEERQKVARERAEMQRILSDERASLVTRRAELELDVKTRLAEMERVAVADRASITALRAELQHAGELEIEKKRAAALDEIADADMKLDEGALATPTFIPPMISPLDEIKFENQEPFARREEPVVAPVAPRRSQLDVAVAKATPVKAEPERRPRWMIAAGIAGVVVLAGIAAAVIGTRGSGAPPIARMTPVPARTVPTASAATPVSRVAATPAIVVDSAVARQWLDSLKREYPADVPSEAEIARARAERARLRAAAAERVAADSLANSGVLSQPPGVSATPRPDTATPP